MGTRASEPEYGSIEGSQGKPGEGGGAGILQTVLSVPARVCFLATFTLLTLPVWAYTLVTDICCCCCGAREGQEGDEARRRRGRFIGRLVAALWRVAFRLCCWIRVETAGLAALRHAGKSGRRVFMAVNHTSWLDTPVACAFLPDHLVGDTKTLMARGHLKLPILGRLANAIGHLPVPFTSRERGDMSVDRERLAETMERTEAHLRAGGHLALFPEGDLNPEWHNLLPFRAGGIELAINFDMEVWGWTVAGAADCWPCTATLGGSPCVIRNKAVLVYPSAKDAAERIAGADADLKTQARALADDLRGKMQRSLDELLLADREGGSA